MRYQDLYDEMINGTARDSLPGWARGVLKAIGSGDFRSPPSAIRSGFLCLPLERTAERAYACTLVRRASARRLHHLADPLSQLGPGQPRALRPGGERARRVTDADELAATHRVFEVVSATDGDRIRADPRTVTVRRGTSEVFGPGHTYTLPAGRFHTQRGPRRRRDRHDRARPRSSGPAATCHWARRTPRPSHLPAPLRRAGGLPHRADRRRASGLGGPDDRRTDLEHARAVAVDAAEAAGRAALRGDRRDVEISAKGGHGDVVTDLDLAAEKLLLERMLTAFPATR